MKIDYTDFKHREFSSEFEKAEEYSHYFPHNNISIIFQQIDE